ncbi:MAG: ATP-binding protein [Ilumatobacteraceae bacterium]
MQISGRPLLATRVDATLYVERGIEAKVITAARRGLNTLIIGDAGAGKTSLLHRLEWELRQDYSSVVYVDGRRSDELDEMLDNLRIQLGIEALPNPSPFAAFSGLNETINGIKSPKFVPPTERTLKRLADKLPADKRKIVLLDSPERKVAHTLFGRLRDVVWQLPISWIVVADSSAADAFRRPPADAFFDLLERLGGISANEGREILRLREVPVNYIADFLFSKATTPRIVLDHARRSILEPPTSDKLQKSDAEFMRRLSVVSRAASMLASELRGQGAVSASDKDLQRRMSWTRERLTQVLKELEAAGLAKATEAADGKPGRPRRFYEILVS